MGGRRERVGCCGVGWGPRESELPWDGEGAARAPAGSSLCGGGAAPLAVGVVGQRGAGDQRPLALDDREVLR